MMIRDSIKKGTKLVFVDFLGLIVGILNGFFLPMVFSIEGYALFKTFTLYATYAVVFSFGLSDGIYLMYGGKSEAETDISETKAYYYFLMKLQAAACVILFMLSYFVIKDTALMFFGFFVIPLQFIHFFRLYYKALGEFDKYSFLQSVLVVFELLNTLLIVFYIKSDSPHLFILIKIINHVIVAVLLSLLFFSKHKLLLPAKLEWSDYYAIMKPGFAVLVADMVAALLFSLDRWFVKVLFDNESFAYYSFDVSMLNLFLVFIASLTGIFYSYISKKLEDESYIKQLKNQVLVISAYFPAGYFILEHIIEAYLPRYAAALDTLWILMLTLPLTGVINVIYINMYKASKSIKVYLYKMLIILAVSFGLNVSAYIIFGTMSAIAWATFFTFLLWYYFSAGDFQTVRTDLKEGGFLFLLFVSLFAVKAADTNLLLALLLSMAALTINVLIFYKKDAFLILHTIRNNAHK